MIYALTVLFIAICIVVLICPIIRSGQISETAQACQARHARAMKAKKTTKLGTMPILSDEWMALAKCRKCEVLHE